MHPRWLHQIFKKTKQKTNNNNKKNNSWKTSFGPHLVLRNLFGAAASIKVSETSRRSCCSCVKYRMACGPVQQDGIKTAYTELSFTKPRTESSWSESWLTGSKSCAGWTWWPRWVAQGRAAGGEGVSSGLMKCWWCRWWWQWISESRRAISSPPQLRPGIEEGSEGWEGLRVEHGPPREVLAWRAGPPPRMTGWLWSSGLVAACKTNLVLWMHWSWAHWVEGWRTEREEEKPGGSQTQQRLKYYRKTCHRAPNCYRYE